MKTQRTNKQQIAINNKKINRYQTISKIIILIGIITAVTACVITGNIN
jgi:hypothetical protein